MDCSIAGCTQPTYNGRTLCYFHKKQASGLIPVSDREFYMKSGDRAATPEQVKLFYQHYPFVKRYAATLIPQFQMREEADDIFQEVYIAWWKACTRGVQMDKPEQYLVVLVRNVFISLFRRERGEIEVENIDVDECVLPDDCISQDAIAALQKALRGVNQSLSTMDRYLLKHYLLAGNRKTLEELGRRFSVSKVAIYHRVAKIRARLREVVHATYCPATY